MEQINELQAKLKTFVGWCERASTAETFAELDEAKVQGLIAFNEMVMQVNRSRVTLTNAADDRRATLAREAFADAQAVVRQGSTTEQIPNNPEQNPTNTEQTTEQTTKKSTKKSANKSKKASQK